MEVEEVDEVKISAEIAKAPLVERI